MMLYKIVAVGFLVLALLIMYAYSEDLKITHFIVIGLLYVGTCVAVMKLPGLKVCFALLGLFIISNLCKKFDNSNNDTEESNNKEQKGADGILIICLALGTFYLVNMLLHHKLSITEGLITIVIFLLMLLCDAIPWYGCYMSATLLMLLYKSVMDPEDDDFL